MRFHHTVGRRRPGDLGLTGRYRALLREYEDLESDNALLQRQVHSLLSLLMAKDQLLCTQGALRYVPFLRLARRYEAEKTRQALIQWQQTDLKGRILQAKRAQAASVLASLLPALLSRLFLTVWTRMRVPRALQRLENRVKRRISRYGFEALRRFVANAAKTLEMRLKAFKSALSSYKSRSLALYLHQIRSFNSTHLLSALLLLKQFVRKSKQKAVFQWIKACKSFKMALMQASHLTETRKLQRSWQSALRLNRLDGIYTRRRRIAACKCWFLWKFAEKLQRNRAKTGLLVCKAVLKQALSRWIWPKAVFRPQFLPFVLRSLVKAQLQGCFRALHSAFGCHFRQQWALSMAQLSSSQSSAEIQLQQLQSEIASLQRAALQAQADSDLQKQQLQETHLLNFRLQEQLDRSAQDKGKLAASVSALNEEKAGLVKELRTRIDHFSVQKQTLERQILDLEAALAASEARNLQKDQEHQSHCLSLQEEGKQVAKEKAQLAAKVEEVLKEQTQVKGTSSQLAAQVLKLSKEIADLKVETR